jgi:hypothetical protein
MQRRCYPAGAQPWRGARGECDEVIPVMIFGHRRRQLFERYNIVSERDLSAGGPR